MADRRPIVLNPTNGAALGEIPSTDNLKVEHITSLADATWTANASRIYGDMDNATQGNRLLFQTTTANGGTSVGAIPNGTGNIANFVAYGKAATANCSYAQLIVIDGSETRLVSGVLGTGTYAPINFYTGGGLRATIDTSGVFWTKGGSANNWGIIRLNDNGGSRQRSIKLSDANELDFVNTAYNSVTHSFNNGGDIKGQGIFYFTGSSGGYGRVHRSVDGDGNYFITLADDVSGAGISILRTPTNAQILTPGNDNGMSCGWGFGRWTAVWAVNGTIQTSDATKKTPVREFSETEISVAKNIAQHIGFFKWLDAIEEKGEDKARWHCGVTVQWLIERFESQGLDPFQYGIICYDKQEATEDNPEEEIYSLRYSELTQFVFRGMAENQKLLEDRLIKLEQLLVGE